MTTRDCIRHIEKIQSERDRMAAAIKTVLSLADARVALEPAFAAALAKALPEDSLND